MASRASLTQRELDETIARIEGTQAELGLIQQQIIKTAKEAQYLSATTIALTGIAFAALLGAGAAIARLFMG